MSNSFLYEKRLFVNRECEIEQICELIDKFEQQATSRQKVIAVHGQRGAGKTWYSLHLHRTVFKQPEYQRWLKWLCRLRLFQTEGPKMMNLWSFCRQKTNNLMRKLFLNC